MIKKLRAFKLSLLKVRKDFLENFFKFTFIDLISTYAYEKLRAFLSSSLRPKRVNIPVCFAIKHKLLKML